MKKEGWVALAFFALTIGIVKVCADRRVAVALERLAVAAEQKSLKKTP